MASNQGKKKVAGTRNPDRKCGKAWKKDKTKPARVRTPERQKKDEVIRAHREERRIRGMERHAAEKEAALQKLAEENAAAAAKLEAERVARALLIENNKKPHPPKSRPPLVDALLLGSLMR